MKEESHHPQIDPELEARIVALVLGEASDFERDELNRLIQDRPELATLKDQIQSVHGLLRDLGTGESHDDNDGWKLPAEKRSAVLAVIGGDEEQQTANQAFNKLAEEPVSGNLIWNLCRIAAVFCFVALAGSIVILPLAKNRLTNSAGFSEISARIGSEDASEHFEEQTALSRDYFATDDAPVTSADEEYVRQAEAASGADLDYEKNSISSLQAIQDALDGDGESSIEEINGPQPSPQQTAGYRLFENDTAAERSGDLEVDGDRPADPQSTAQMAAEGELDFPKFAQSRGELGVIDFVEPASTTTSVPDRGTVLHGGTRRSAGVRSVPDLSREPPGSPPATEKYAESDSWRESQEAASEHGAVSGLEVRPPMTRQPLAGEDGTIDGFGPGESLGGGGYGGSAGGYGGYGGYGGGGGAAFGDDSVRSEHKSEMSAEHSRQGISRGQPGVLRDTREAEAAPSQPMMLGVDGGIDATEAEGVPNTEFFDAEMSDPARSAYSIPSPTDEPMTSKEHLRSKGNLTVSDRYEEEAGQVKQDSDLGFAKDWSRASGRQRWDLGTTPGLRMAESEREIDKRVKNSLGEISERAELDKRHLFRLRGEPAIAGQSAWYRYVPPTPEEKSKLVKKVPAKKPSTLAGLNEKAAKDEAFSTFSLHVSDVSFKLARAALAQGEWPEAAKVRIEEFVNAFDYGDPLPRKSERVACCLEQSIHPFLQQRNLMRVAVRTAAAGRSSNIPLRLTFLLDNSGSMERPDRQQTVRRAFALLAQQLKPIDQATLISFAREPRLLADKVGGAQSQQLVELIDNLPSEGGTNIEAALQLAFEKAREQQIDGAQNRIILLTDGAVNLGDADPDSLSQMITTMRDAGIAFDAAGISAEGLNDEILEALTRKGDGRYYLLDSPEVADDGFVQQIAGALRPSAKNVKVQVEFNPRRVGRYKLLGYEKHRLNKEDFRNDKVDAAEMAAAEAGVAIYQFEAKPDGQGDVGSVSVRFRDLSTGQMIEKRWPIPYRADAPRPDQATPSLRMATSAALLAAKLRGEPLGEAVDLKVLSDLITGLPGRVRTANRVQQLQQMIQQARQISGK